MRIFTLILFICVTLFKLNSQNNKTALDLQKTIEVDKDDSVKVENIIQLAMLVADTNAYDAIKHLNKALELSKQLKLFKHQVRVYNRMGDLHFGLTNFNKSFLNYYKAYKLSDSIKDLKLYAFSCYNLGWVAAIEQESFEDVKYIYTSIKISEQNKYNFLRLQNYNAIANFYSTRFHRSDDKMYFDSSIKYFIRGIDLIKELKLQNRAGAFYLNMGQLFEYAKDYNSAIFYYNKTLELIASDSSRIVHCVYHIGICEYGLGKKKEALAKYLIAYNYFTRTKVIAEIKDISGSLASYYEDAGNYKEALKFKEEYHAIVLNTSKELHTTSVNNLELGFKFEKSEADLMQLKQANEINELKSKRKTLFIYALTAIGLLFVGLAYLLFRQNKLKHNSNLKLAEQNKIISEKKLEIEQSIEYAKGIQTVFLPEIDFLNDFVKESFVLYKPKDVVSGDFYWINIAKNKSEALIACADCTGHGVPGALMSMVGINALNQLHVEKKLSSPGEMLSELNNQIKNSLKQNSQKSKQQDGMDIALIKLNLIESKLWYSGANRSLFIVREKEVIEQKATKYAIGGYTSLNHKFEEHEISLQPGDFICLATDGYADQFGGVDGKKFMTKNFKKLLVNISDLKAYEQQKYLNETFEAWRGPHAQVDDVCVIGIKI